MKKDNYPKTAMEEFGCRHPEITLAPSEISDQDIAALEKKLHISIPSIVKNYLQSYTLSAPFVTGKMLGDFSQTYCEETGKWRIMDLEEEIATTKIQLPLMSPNTDLRRLEESNRPFIGSGFLYLGLYNEEHYVLLDLQSEQVYRVDMGRVRPTLGNETRADILKWALPFFNSFEDLMRCFFAGELYDEDEMIFVTE